MAAFIVMTGSFILLGPLAFLLVSVRIASSSGTKTRKRDSRTASSLLTRYHAKSLFLLAELMRPSQAKDDADE